jgi:hypothetical protein
MLLEIYVIKHDMDPNSYLSNGRKIAPVFDIWILNCFLIHMTKMSLMQPKLKLKIVSPDY